MSQPDHDACRAEQSLRTIAGHAADIERAATEQATIYSRLWAARADELQQIARQLVHLAEDVFGGVGQDIRDAKPDDLGQHDPACAHCGGSLPSAMTGKACCSTACVRRHAQSAAYPSDE